MERTNRDLWVQWPSMPGARGKKHRGALGVVDYTLAKRALIREFRGGLLSRLEICDAHPELLRAARYLGIDASRPCPVCKGSELRLLAYVYADGLRQNNGRAFQIEDAMTLASAHRGGTCYVVEVCTDCCWNHLSKALVAREGQWNLPAAAGNGSLALTSPSPRNLH